MWTVWPSRRAILVLALMSAVAVMVVPAGRGRSVHPSAATCASGAVAVRIGGKSVCLHTGAACKRVNNSIYRKHGFTCISGRLRKISTTNPPPPPPPYSPPTGPVGTANTTVTVEMDDNPIPLFVLSQATIPSGNVTFTITNKCLGPCSFDLQGIKAGTMMFNVGQTETWTVALAPGTYRYHCDYFPGMKGEFTVT